MEDKLAKKKKKQLYRWIGLGIGLIFGLVIGYFGYYQGIVKKKAPVYFQKNIGEVGFMTEYQKWAAKNPLQAQEMAVKIWKELGLYEELKNETNQEVIQQKIMARIEQMTDDQKEETTKKTMKIYEKHAPSFLEKLEKKFPWYLRYSKTIFFLIILGASGIGFLIGYLLEPEEEVY